MTTQRAEGVPRGRAALNGVLATGAGLGAGHFASLLAPASSPVVAVASRFIDLTPGPVKDWATSTLGTADKPVLVVGAIIVTLGLGALVGILARRSTPAGLVASAALAAIAIAAAQPNSGREVLWWAPGVAALLVGAWALNRLVRTSAAADVAPAPDGRGRRAWFRLALGVGGLGVVAALIGQWPRGGGTAQAVTLPTRSLTPLPTGLETRVPGLSPFVTPASDFYRIDTALSAPSVEASTWHLSISGLVDHPFTISWDELLAMDAIERPVTLECVSNEVGQNLIGSAMWLGVRTSELLARAGVQAGADMVLSSSIDNFSVSTPLGALTDDRDAFVAYGMNGAALPQEHGFPVRLLTPGLYGFVGATKWLTTMEVTTYAKKQAYWTKLGWSDHGPIKPSSRIEVPRPGAHVPAGSVTVGGTAWAHGVGVGKVQVRVDQGPWNDVTLGPDAGIEYWRQWLWTWDAAKGEHDLQVRVVDTAGTPQVEATADPFPNGASGLHTVHIVVG